MVGNQIEHRLAFRLTIYLFGFAMVPIIASALFFKRVSHPKLLLLLLLAYALFSIYQSLKKILNRAVFTDGFCILRDGNILVNPNDAVWPFVWGFFWRSMLINPITSALASALFEFSKFESHFNWELGFIGWYLGSLWLLRYQYGRLQITHSESEFYINSSNATKVESHELVDVKTHCADHQPDQKDPGLNPIERLRDIFKLGLGMAFMAFYFALGVFVPAGCIYWVWKAVKLSSFSMFLVGAFPLTTIPACIVGAYGLIFDMPEWVYNWFS